MPCPETFRESLLEFQVEPSVCTQIDAGYESLASSSPKRKKAAYFKRAVDILDASLPPERVRAILEWNACCKSGARLAASREFARINQDLPLPDKLQKIAKAPYRNMGRPELDADGTLLLHAVSYVYEGRYACGCSNYRRANYEESVSKHYCYCCGGHFRFHYEIMLGIKLELLEVVSSPLDSGGASPCAFRYRIVEAD